jgi:undecaprenyl-diphosphatase
MDIGYCIFKGLIQGLTEFLPISSTAHLTFTKVIFERLHWVNTLKPGEDEFFDILLHLGTLVAVVYYFRQDLLQIVKVWRGKANDRTADLQSGLLLKPLPLFIGGSTLVTMVFIVAVQKISGLVMKQMGWATATMHDLSDYYFEHPHWVAIHLLVTGCLLYFSEKMSQKKAKPLSGKNFSWFNAISIGLLQGCAAIFHGISRSGSTISAGLATGLDRTTATRYTFLLSIPVFTMAAVYEFLKMDHMGSLASLNWPAMMAGTVVSGIVGYYCVKYLIQFVAKNSLTVFALYCWLLGLVMFSVLK